MNSIPANSDDENVIGAVAVAMTESAVARIDAASLRPRMLTEADLVEIREAWNHLAGEMPFRRWEWLITWWKHYARRGDRLFLLALHDEQNHLVGLTPWYRSTSLSQGRVIRFLGSGEVCSDHLSLLCEPGHEIPVARAVAQWLLFEAADQWGQLELIGVDADDLAITCLVQELEAAGMHCDATGGQRCWRLTFPSTWEDYVQGLSKSRRGRVRSLQRRVFEAGRGQWSVARSVDEALTIFDTLIQLHQRRRISLGQPGCFASPTFEAFHREVIHLLWPEGGVRLGWVELNGTPASAEYDVLGGDTIYMYQSGMDPDRAHERPGWLGAIGALQSALRAGYRHFDFLRGDEEYKSHWRALPVATVEHRVTADRVVPRARRWSRQHTVQLKQWLKRNLLKQRQTHSVETSMEEASPDNQHAETCSKNAAI